LQDAENAASEAEKVDKAIIAQENLTKAIETLTEVINQKS